MFRFSRLREGGLGRGGVKNRGDQFKFKIYTFQEGNKMTYYGVRVRQVERKQGTIKVRKLLSKLLKHVRYSDIILFYRHRYLIKKDPDIPWSGWHSII
jgi:hypothetical protein